MKSGLAAVVLLWASFAGAQEWPRGTPAEAGLDAGKLEAMEQAVQAGEFKKIGSVLVARHGKLVYEKYFDGDATTQRNTRSATKSVTSLLVGIAIQQHQLSGVDARVLPLLPQHRPHLQNPDPRKEKITVEDLLTMSNPLECDDWNDASRGNEEKMYLVEDWGQFILDLPMRGRMHGPKPETPKYGRYFSYCTGGVFLLSEILTKTTGERTDRFAQRVLFDPMGIAAKDVSWAYSPMDIPQTGGGLEFTSLDLLKFPQLVLQDGKWEGKQLVDPAWIRALSTPHAQIDDHTEYGYLWWLTNFEAGGKSYPAVYMTGNGGNKVLVFPTLDMAVVITSTNYGTRGMHEQTQKLLQDYILGALRDTK